MLYGSDGLAGLVNVITYEPSDFLAATGQASKELGGRIASGWSGDDQGVNLAATVAGRAIDAVQWLMTGTTRRSKGLDNLGSNDESNVNRTRPNPQANRSDSFLGKLVLRPDAVQKHVLTLEHVGKNSDTELLSSRASSLPSPTTTATKALVAGENDANAARRDRLTWDARYILDSAWADRLQTVVSLQNSDAQDNGRTVRNDGGVRIRDTSYNEHAWQASVQASKAFALSDQWSQRFTYGLDPVSYTHLTLPTNREV